MAPKELRYCKYPNQGDREPDQENASIEVEPEVQEQAKGVFLG